MIMSYCEWKQQVPGSVSVCDTFRWLPHQPWSSLLWAASWDRSVVSSTGVASGALHISVDWVEQTGTEEFSLRLIPVSAKVIKYVSILFYLINRFKVHIVVFRVVAPYSLVQTSTSISDERTAYMKIDAVSSFKALASTYQTTWCHNSQDCSMNVCWSENRILNLKLTVLKLLFV
jgi:hypothetical protein